MPQITNFTEAQDALRPFYDYSKTPYTLDVMRTLMQYLDNPQDKIRVVHVAGTSGKTSTAYYAAALLKASGKTVGLSVSPHVDTVNERVQINGAPLPEAEFCTALGEFLDIVAEAPVQPSYFELLVALAYWEFARRGLDYAVMEVGLGGLLDGTNVVTRADKVCVITDIGLDHTEILGDTVEKIAAQKAGIIHAGNEVFMYTQEASVMEVVREVATREGAQLHQLPDSSAIVRPGLPLFQQRNLGLAVAAISRALQTDLSKAAIDAAVQLQVPARLERFTIGGKTVIVDGSHNQQKIHALLESVAQLYPGQSIAALCAFVKGNDERWQGGLGELLPAANYILFTTFHGEQDLPKSSIPTDKLAEFCRTQQYTSFSIEDDPAAALAALLARPETVLLITGSFYLLNHLRPLVRDQQ
jgi:dihydrofolate synthase / folylpolyglutamate synthase